MTILVIWLKSDKVADTVDEDLRRFMIYRRDWSSKLRHGSLWRWRNSRSSSMTDGLRGISTFNIYRF